MIAIGRRLGVVAALAGLILMAAVSLNRVYNGHLLVELVAGAAIGSVAFPLLLRRAPAVIVAPLSLIALAGYALYAVRVSAAAGGISGDLAGLTQDAARNALPRLLTALIPVEPQPDTVLAPIVLAWLAGLAAAEFAVRANRPAIACIPPVLLYAGALVLVGPNAPVAIWQPVAVAGFIAFALAVGRTGPVAARPPRSRTDAVSAHERMVLRTRAALGLAGGVAALLVVVAAVSPLIAHRVDASPPDPRTLVHPPDLDVLDENPLIRISGWAANPSQHLFDVKVLGGTPGPVVTATPTPSASSGGSGGSGDSGGSGGGTGGPGAGDSGSGDAGDAATPAYDTRLRLAVLEQWDGVTWHASADYRGAGRVLPPLDVPADWSGHPDAKPLNIQEKITVAGLQGRLLPAVPTPSRVDGLRVAYDRASGTLIQDAPLHPGLAYTVSSVNDAVDLNLLPAADVPSGPAVAPLLAVGDEVPPDLTDTAQKIAAGATSAYDKAVALQDFLAQHYRFAADAPSGHAYPNLRFFLYGDPAAGGGRGTSEQFATAFATLGRLMGLPTRVVVGFHTPVGGVVTAGDALAWPEVLFTDVGWVAFDPLPQAGSTPQPLDEQFMPPSQQPTQPPQTVPPPSSTYTPTPAASGSGTSAGAGGLTAGVVAGGIGGGLLLGGLAVVMALLLLRASLRRRHLDRGTPPDKVLGAWDEVLDALLLAGRPPPPNLAASGVAAHAADVAAGEPGRRHARRPRPAAPALDDLAHKVNTVGFAPSSASTDDLAAHSARMAALDYARAVRARRPWWRRLLWSIDPRPLWR